MVLKLALSVCGNFFSREENGVVFLDTEFLLYYGENMCSNQN
jgi:hypothetical protein